MLDLDVNCNWEKRKWREKNLIVFLIFFICKYERVFKGQRDVDYVIRGGM